MFSLNINWATMCWKITPRARQNASDGPDVARRPYFSHLLSQRRQVPSAAWYQQTSQININCYTESEVYIINLLIKKMIAINNCDLESKNKWIATWKNEKIILNYAYLYNICFKLNVFINCFSPSGKGIENKTSRWFPGEINCFLVRPNKDIFKGRTRRRFSSLSFNLRIRQGSISPAFYEQLFVRKSFELLFCAYVLGLYFFGKRKLAQKLLIKCWWNWLKVSISPSTWCKLN